MNNATTVLVDIHSSIVVVKTCPSNSNKKMKLKSLAFLMFMTCVSGQREDLTVLQIKEILLHRGGIQINSIMRMCGEDAKEHRSLANGVNKLCKDFVSGHVQNSRPGYNVIEYLPHYFLNEIKDIYR